jgi:hypothetical protein
MSTTYWGRFTAKDAERGITRDNDPFSRGKYIGGVLPAIKQYDQHLTWLLLRQEKRKNTCQHKTGIIYLDLAGLGGLATPL